MNAVSPQTEGVEVTQTARILAFTPTIQNDGLDPYTDTLDHIKALELEATLMLALAYTRRRRSVKNSSENDLPRFPLVSTNADSDEIIAVLEKVRSENRMREAETLRCGITLNYVQLCEDWGLDQFERWVVMLLLMQYIAPDFISLFGDCKFERGRGNGMEIGTLLSIVCPDLRSQLDSRRYFSVTSTLLRDDIIVMNGSVDETTNILDETVCLHERLVRHILGDDNLYNSLFKYIKRENCSVSLDQVIIPPEIKNKLVESVETYLEGRKNGKFDKLDEFYGYGTGLTFMFYGPSGTGKTMLARALATCFGRPIFSLTANNLRDMPGSYDDILGTLFREAALQGAIVFLDECDDIFENNGQASRSLLIEIEKARCVVIMATNKPVDLDPALERRITMKVNFQLPDEALRLKMWKALLPTNVTLSPDVDLSEFASRYRFTGGLIRNSIFLALTLTDCRDGETLITADVLHQAAAMQIGTLTDEQGLCRAYSPEVILENLPLRPRQKSEIRNLAEVWKSLKQQDTGLSLVISSTNITAGVQVVEGLADSCHLKVRAFDFQRVISLSQDERIIDPVTQRKVTPLEYAFAPASSDDYLTLFIDHDGQLENMLIESKDKIVDMYLPSVLAKLRSYNGIFCIVTRDMKSPKIPTEINMHLRIEHPAEENQIQNWEDLLGGFCSNEEQEIVQIVEDYPLHLPEIHYIYRQAYILSTIRRMDKRPVIAEIREVLEGYRKKKTVPLLFGRQ